VFAGATGLPLVVGAGDPGSSRLVYAMVVGLVVVGIAFIVLAVWLIRQTRYDLPVLAPLERMGDRDWRRKSDPATQRRILDEVRPEGAQPLRSGSSPPSIDAEFELSERPVASMSDLAPAERPDFAPPAAETRSATPRGLDRPDLLDFEPDGAVDSAGDGGPGEPADEPVRSDAASTPESEAETDVSPDEPSEGPALATAEDPATADELADHVVIEPVDEEVDDAVDEPVDEEVDDAVDEPVDEPADAAGDGDVEGAVDEPADVAVHGETDAVER
jgi:hypothetical protein